ncbi:MAG: hypothetical protein RR959_09040 [Erysipelotrichaceae bacterium]
MIKSFTKNGKYYYCKKDQNTWSQWACRHEDGLETWAGVKIASYKITRQHVIDAINDVDDLELNKQ